MELIKKEVFVVRGNRNHPLYVRRYSGKMNDSGVVQIIHGMSEHGGRYEAFANFLATNGYVVYCHDHRKHGKSVVETADLGIFDDDDWFDLTGDVNLVQDEIIKRERVDKVSMLGHSLGSMILRSFLIEYGDRVDKAVIMGTPKVSQLLNYPAIVLSRMLELFTGTKRSVLLTALSMGSYQKPYQPEQTGKEWLTRDVEFQQLCVNDHLSGFHYSPRFYNQILKGFNHANGNIIKSPDIPLLFISGQEDVCGGLGKGPTQAYGKYHRAGYDCQLELIENFRHEVLNEIGNEYAYEMILKFFNK